MAVAINEGLSCGTRKGWSCPNASTVPPMRVATTGRANAIASSTTRGRPSKSEGSTNKSAAARRSGTSDAFAEKRDVRKFKGGCQFHHCPSLKPVADQEENDIRYLSGHVDSCLQQDVVTLLRCEPSHSDNERGIVVDPQDRTGLCPGPTWKRCFNPVADRNDVDKALRSITLCGGFRHDNQRVGKASGQAMAEFLVRICKKVREVLRSCDGDARHPARPHQFMAFPADACMDMKDCRTARFEPRSEVLVECDRLEARGLAPVKEARAVACNWEGKRNGVCGRQCTRERQHVFANAGRHGAVRRQDDLEMAVSHSAAAVQCWAATLSAFCSRRNVARACPTT